MIIGYARVSTDDQSLQLQIAALERFGVDVIIQEKASGKTVQRPKFGFLVEHGMRRGDTLVVWKLDRLGRNLRQVLEVMEEFQRRGVELVSITDGFDARTPMGKAMMQISLVFAELERNLISERTKAGMEAARKAGKTFGRKPLILGYPARVKALRKLDKAGKLRTSTGDMIMTDAQIMEELNNVKDAPPIENIQTVRRWRREQNCPGLDPVEDGEAKDK